MLFRLLLCILTLLALRLNLATLNAQEIGNSSLTDKTKNEPNNTEIVKRLSKRETDRGTCKSIRNSNRNSTGSFFLFHRFYC